MVGDREAPNMKHASLMVSRKVLRKGMNAIDRAYLGERKNKRCFYATVRFYYIAFERKMLWSTRGGEHGAPSPTGLMRQH
jgi:hypothetical protein